MVQSGRKGQVEEAFYRLAFHQEGEGGGADWPWPSASSEQQQLLHAECWERARELRPFLPAFRGVRRVRREGGRVGQQQGAGQQPAMVESPSGSLLESKAEAGLSRWWVGVGAGAWAPVPGATGPHLLPA